MKNPADLFRNKKQLNRLTWVFMSLFLVLSLLGIQSREDSLRIRSVEVSIEPKEELAFLDSQKVTEILKGGDSAGMLIGAEAGALRIDEMEAALERYPFIEKADVSTDLGGKLIVRVLQRNPVLRVFNKKGQSFYVAKNGYKMPLHPGFAPRVLAASGNIAENLEDTAFAGSRICRDLLKIALYCSSDRFWHAQIEQLYVDNYMDILLIPKVGNHSIVFGSADHTEKKFEALKTFYTKGLNATGWDRYRRIDLRFEGQIVAERRNTEQHTPITQP